MSIDLNLTFPLFVSLVLNGLVLGMLLFLIASGLSLIFGLMGVLNFAHGSLFTLGAYVGLAVYSYSGSFFLAGLAGTVTGALLGAVIETLGIKPLYGRHIYQVLLTLGLFLVINELVQLIWGPAILGFPQPPWIIGTVDILGLPFPRYRLVVLGLGLMVLGLVYLFLNRTRMGIIVRAGIQDSEMVQALGINVRRVFTGVFALGGALAGLGGVVAGPFFRSAWPQMGLENQLSAFVVVVIGGLGSYAGSAVGSILVGLSQSLVGYFFPDAALAVNVGLMALVLLIKPEGFFGTRRG